MRRTVFFFKQPGTLPIALSAEHPIWFRAGPDCGSVSVSLARNPLSSGQDEDHGPGRKNLAEPLTGAESAK